eukprot:jgi/Botrbrau1/21372/Bobra.0422s0001.1
MDHRWSPHTARNPTAVPVQNPINKYDVKNTKKNEGKTEAGADSMWRSVLRTMPACPRSAVTAV